MTYNKTNDLPSGIKDNLSSHGTKSDILDYIAKSFSEVTELAAAERTQPKEQLVELSMYVTKATLDTTGRMVWDATASDTGKDSFNEQMSIRLYKSFLDYREGG